MLVKVGVGVALVCRKNSVLAKVGVGVALVCRKNSMLGKAAELSVE